MQSRASRVARGWIVGSFATGIAATSHGIAAGTAPSGLALGGALLFAGVLGTFVVGSRPSLPRLIAIVAGSQLAFHLVFSWLTPGTAATAVHHQTPAVLQPAAAHHGTDPGMWAAHALAMLVTIVFLHRAELALWSLLRDAVDVIRFRPPVVVATPRTTLAVSAEAPRHPVPALFLSIVSHRGPPASGFTS